MVHGNRTHGQLFGDSIHENKLSPRRHFCRTLRTCGRRCCFWSGRDTVNIDRSRLQHVRHILLAVEQRLEKEVNSHLLIQVLADMVVGDVGIEELGPEFVRSLVVLGEQTSLVPRAQAVDEECEVLHEAIRCRVYEIDTQKNGNFTQTLCTFLKQ